MNKLYNHLLQSATYKSAQRFYKSAICLENLYPDSSLKLTTPTKPDSSMNDQFTGYIPLDQLDIQYSRSSGPGGQNVNKVNTKVDLRLHLATAKWLHENIRTKLAVTYKTRITKDGYFVFRSDITRNQQLNLADCLEKLRSAIRTVCQQELKPISEETVERIRRRQERENMNRLILKREKAQTKSSRQSLNIRDVDL